ncbi:MAG: indole-3-glycerol-phosphate synthase [Methanobacteriota archaeon]|nr:MAG: indole-3-glycerol-phosphate synthase [Euryarchaeota archaeon]
MHKSRHIGKVNFDSILERCRERYTPFQIEIERTRKPLNMAAAIEKARSEGRNPVISEIKYRSPTGMNRQSAPPQEIARAMIKGGACAISVLTEPEFFGGSLETLRTVKEASSVPVLRKDFLFHPAQIPESYYYGADSVLLISSFFTTERLKDMVRRSRDLGMEPVVEVHSHEDIERASAAGARIYLINNRDKDTLELDIGRTAAFAPHIRGGVKISASGIEDAAQLREVLNHADAALIGTSIMNAEDIESKVSSFVEG